MADKTSTNATEKTPEQKQREEAIAAWYDADTPQKKKDAVQKYPVLKTIFSTGQY